MRTARPLACLVVAAALGFAVAGGPLAAQPREEASHGILLLAHGGSATWNAHVTDIANAVNQDVPVEVAFGMASRAAIGAAIDRLVGRGVDSVTAVPLFVSSWSSVITSTEYLLGLRAEAPRDLALFARMDHTSHGAPAARAPSGPAGSAAGDPTAPLELSVPIRMTPALNRHPTVGRILADRARSISTSAQQEAVVLVAHGPVPDEDNRRWLDDMAVLAEQVRASAPYAAVHYLTVRDDAGAAMREAATRELRALVERESSDGRRVLIIPHVLSFGGIEQGIRKRLEGLPYTMAGRAIIPDSRIEDWVREQLESAGAR